MRYLIAVQILSARALRNKAQVRPASGSSVENIARVSSAAVNTRLVYHFLTVFVLFFLPVSLLRTVQSRIFSRQKFHRSVAKPCT